MSRLAEGGLLEVYHSLIWTHCRENNSNQNYRTESILTLHVTKWKHAIALLIQSHETGDSSATTQPKTAAHLMDHKHPTQQPTTATLSAREVRGNRCTTANLFPHRQPAYCWQVGQLSKFCQHREPCRSAADTSTPRISITNTVISTFTVMLTASWLVSKCTGKAWTAQQSCVFKKKTSASECITLFGGRPCGFKREHNVNGVDAWCNG